MKRSTLVSTAELSDHLDDPSWILIDCRFNLNFPEKGENDYLKAHIPGALYAHLDRDLSAPVGNGKRGRHPLPDPETCVQTFSSFGIEAGKQVVAYDDCGAAISARLCGCCNGWDMKIPLCSTVVGINGYWRNVD